VRLQVLSLTVGITSAITVAACAGLVEGEAYQPVQVGQPDPKIHRPHAAVRLSDASIVVFPVVVSEQLRRIYGPALILPTFWEEKAVVDKPLRLEVWLKLPSGDAMVDFSGAAVRLGERTVYPTFVGRKWTGERSEGAVRLAGQTLAHVFELNFEVRTTQLQPFTLYLPDLQINGRMVSVDPIAFQLGRYDSPR
jgi:hypothetical protein